VDPATFVAAIGATVLHKSEIHPRLMALAKVVTDLTAQATAMGDLHHAPQARAHAELGEVLAGASRTNERRRDHRLRLQPGIAFTDVAAAACAYERRSHARVSTTLDVRCGTEATMKICPIAIAVGLPQVPGNSMSVLAKASSADTVEAAKQALEPKATAPRK
jgi:hypothetical protein